MHLKFARFSSAENDTIHGRCHFVKVADERCCACLSVKHAITIIGSGLLATIDTLIGTGPRQLESCAATI